MIYNDTARPLLKGSTMALINTNEMCMVYVDGRCIDMGNYYIDEQSGKKVLVTSLEIAEKFAQLVSVPVYIRKEVIRHI